MEKLNDADDPNYRRLRFSRGSQPPKQQWSELPLDGYVRMLQIRDFTQSERTTPEYVVRTKNLKTCQDDDILIGRYGASVGKILTGLSGAYNVAIVKTIPDQSRLSKPYLYFVLRSPSFQSFISTVGGRAAQAGFNKADLTHYLIPLPSLDEQKRIAYLLSKVEGLIAQRKQHLRQLDDLLKSVFLDMFGDPTGNVHDWEVEELKHLTGEKIGYGIVQPGQPVEDGVPVIRVGDFVGTQIHSTNITMVAKEVSEKHKASILKGDEILLACVGTIGKVALVEPKHKGHNIVRATARIRTSDRVGRIFLAHYLLSEFAQRYYSNVTRAVGQPTLNIKQIEELPVAVPPMPLQTAFAIRAKAIETLRTSLQESLNSLKHLFGIVSQQAFSGELDLSRVFVPEAPDGCGEAEPFVQTEANTDDPVFELPTPKVRFIDK